MKDYLQTLDDTVVEMTAPEADFEVVEQVINGVTRKIYSKSPPTLREYLQLMNNHADATFMVHQDERYTFAQAYDLSARLANALVTDYGVKAGDRVAIAMRNNPQWVMAFTAIVSIGAVAVPMNGWWTTDELRYGFSDSGAKLTICDSQRCERIRPFAQELGIGMIVTGDEAGLAANEKSFDSFISNAPNTMPELSVAPEDLATIMYTSGSTGNPKGVMATHRSIVSALFSWINSAYATIGADIKTGVNKESATVQAGILLTIPLFHVTACHTIFLLSVLAGRKMTIMYKWDVEEALRLIEQEKLTNFSGVPTMSAELAQAAAKTSRDISTLREIQAGGAPRPPEQVKKLNKTFSNASAGLGYGLTETNGIGTVIAGPLYSLNPASSGRVVPALTELKVIDVDGNSLAANEAGEVCIKSVCLANGYWNNPTATAEVFVDGWFHTGDVGKIDDNGFLVILDRIKDIIIRGGENISCIEVEAALYEHTDIEEVAVFGLPNEALGEAVGAVVVSQNTGLTCEQLQQFVAERLAGFKIPAHIWVVNEKLPRIATGKIYKKGLKADYAAQLGG